MSQTITLTGRGVITILHARYRRLALHSPRDSARLPVSLRSVAATATLRLAGCEGRGDPGCRVEVSWVFRADVILWRLAIPDVMGSLCGPPRLRALLGVPQGPPAELGSGTAGV